MIKQIAVSVAALVLAGFATVSSAGTAVATLQVSLQITESCQVNAQASGQQAVQPHQVAVTCAFQAPVRVTQTAVSTDAPEGSQQAQATSVTTLVF